MNRDPHHVTAKVALFSPDKTKVILVEYLPDQFGLPGGHLDDGEEPKVAAIRELNEELGLTLSPTVLKEADFWKHPNGKIILGFTATIEESTKIMIDPSEIRSVRWVNIDDIRRGNISAGTYDRLILAA